MTRSLDVDEIARICNNIGKHVHARFPETPAWDLAQEVWLWVAEHEAEVLEWPSEVSGGLVETTGSTPRLYRRGYRVATAYAKRQRAARLGYEPQDEFYYSIGLLRRVLPLWLEELRTGALIIPDRDVVLDLERGWPLLRKENAALLREVFRRDKPFADMCQLLAQHYKITPDSIEKRVDRALGDLRRVLGGPSPYDGGRKAISNAQARAITAHQHEG